jgi:hypothetical protein
MSKIRRVVSQTLRYEPFIKSQLALIQLTLEIFWCNNLVRKPTICVVKTVLWYVMSDPYPGLDGNRQG